MPSIIYIDPQSYNNLSLYDHGMMTSMSPEDVVLFGSSQWDCSLPNANLKKWFTYNNKKSSLVKGLSYLSTLLRIALYISKHPKIRIVHIQWLRLWRADIAFLKWLKRKGIKVIFTAHNILPHDTGDTQREKYGIYYRTVDCICVHTEYTKVELVTQFGIEPDKIEIIPHGIIETDICEEVIVAKSEKLRREYDISKEMIVISSLGLQSFYKGIDNLIEVWSEEKELYLNSGIKLMIVGKNSGLDYSLLNGIENVIIIDERVSNEEFQAFLEISDVILLPYRRISQSGVLFSAIARNKPVIVSDVGGLPDPLKIGNVGWNMGASDKNNLRKILLNIIHNTQELKKIQSDKSEFESVKDYYSWNTISNKLKKLYDKLVSQ